MEQNTDHLIPEPDTISEKLRDTEALNRVVKQAVTEAVDKARKLGFLHEVSVQEDGAEYKTTK